MEALFTLILLGGGLYFINRKISEENDTIGGPLENDTDVVDVFAGTNPETISSIPTQKVIIVGDSLAVGLSKFGLGQRARDAGYPVSAHAVGGTRAADWANRLYGILKKEGLEETRAPGEKSPVLVLVSLGTNDSGPDWAGNRPPAVGQAMQDIVKTVRGLFGADLVWIGMPELPYSKLPNQDRIRKLTADLLPDYIDSSKFKIQKSSDEIHPTPVGYDQWSAEIWTDLQRRGVVKTTKNA